MQKMHLQLFRQIEINIHTCVYFLNQKKDLFKYVKNVNVYMENVNICMVKQLLNRKNKHTGIVPIIYTVVTH